MILGQGTGSHMLQLRPGAVRQINKIIGFFFFKEEDAVHIYSVTLAVRKNDKTPFTAT